MRSVLRRLPQHLPGLMLQPLSQLLLQNRLQLQMLRFSLWTRHPFPIRRGRQQPASIDPAIDGEMGGQPLTYAVIGRLHFVQAAIGIG